MKNWMRWILICLVAFLGEICGNELKPYLKELEEKGYCVIPNVVSPEEAQELYERVWHEYIEKAWPMCRLDNRSNWKEVFPKHNKLGVFTGPAAQIQVMWDLRQDPRVIEPYKEIWNTEDLIVSMDGFSLMCPPEIREGFIDPWPHVDQTIQMTRGGSTHNNNPNHNFVSESVLKTKPYTVQGQFVFQDSLEGDGGFFCIPGSHNRFEEFAPDLQMIELKGLTFEEKCAARRRFVEAFFRDKTDEEGNAYVSKHITARKGSMILWDSRTIHWNQHAEKDRAFKESPTVRLVGYLSYVPKSRLDEEGKRLRKFVFENGVATGHNPAVVDIRRTIDHIQPEYLNFLEDPSYEQPKIKLTSRGESLLGY